MEISLEWLPELNLGAATSKKLDEIYNNANYISEQYACPGIYVFGRKWGVGFAPVYIGQAGDMRQRVRSQMNNRQLTDAVRDSGNGEKVVLFGKWLKRGPQNQERCLTVAENALIRDALSKGYEIVNISGTKRPHHSVDSHGNRLFGRAFSKRILTETRE
jgi:hypothetical protein